jgi:hypothetical protein
MNGHSAVNRAKKLPVARRRVALQFAAGNRQQGTGNPK